MSQTGNAKASSRVGRAPTTTHAEISRIGLKLFIENGFDVVTIDDISAACGIGRRTFFRYFPSKNDLPWGRFDEMLDGLREHLRSLGDGLPLADALRVAIIAFNDVPPEEIEPHRQRMELLLRVPTLLAHSTLRYESWRQAIAEYVAWRTDCDPQDHGPQTSAWVCLGISLAAYEQWLREDCDSLSTLLDEGFQNARTLLAAAGS